MTLLAITRNSIAKKKRVQPRLKRENPALLAADAI